MTLCGWLGVIYFPLFFKRPKSRTFVPKSTECYWDVNLIPCIGRKTSRICVYVIIPSLLRQRLLSETSASFISWFQSSNLPLSLFRLRESIRLSRELYIRYGQSYGGVKITFGKSFISHNKQIWREKALRFLQPQAFLSLPEGIIKCKERKRKEQEKKKSKK